MVPFGSLAGSNGVLGGRSIIDPDGFPFSAKQTGLLERLTPRSEGGPNPDTEPAPENDKDPSKPSKDVDAKKEADPSQLSDEEKKAIAEEQDEKNFRKLESELKEKISENKKLANIKDQLQITRDKQGLRIEIIDKADFAMFPSGTTNMQGKAEALIAEVAASPALREWRTPILSTRATNATRAIGA